MGKVRGVRFTGKEEALIEEFLQKNPLIDFSTLAKVSILEFIKNPQIHLVGVKQPKQSERRHVRPS